MNLSIPFPRSRKRFLARCALVATLTLASTTRAADSADATVRTAFEKGTLAEGQRVLETSLAAHPAEAARLNYALGVVRFLRAGEKLGQAWHHDGLFANRLTNSLPFFRLPVGPADEAAASPVAYEDVRAAFIQFLADLKTADDTFAALPDDPGKVALRPGLVRVDYVGNGKPADTETVWKTYQKITPGGAFEQKDVEEFLIKFDAGDVPWFRGYCHLLSAVVETLLAYDESALFDHTAHLFFSKPRTPYPFLMRPSGNAMNFDVAPISDLLAFVHLLNFPPREPTRLAAALDHLVQVPKFSRESWRRILAETDDDHEWIPNPRQKGALPNAGVTQERVDAWLRMLNEADAILAGKKLVPFWREGSGKAGLNLRRVFEQQSTFDLFLWIQGTAATQYLEDGPVTDPEVWRGWRDAFSGEALGFSLYFN